MNHLENMEALRESVRLRAYGQHEPLVEYRREGSLMFKQLLAEFEKWMSENAERFRNNESGIMNNELSKNNLKNSDHNSKFQIPNSKGKVGRNDPCPCKSGKKYKKCHGK